MKGHTSHEGFGYQEWNNIQKDTNESYLYLPNIKNKKEVTRLIVNFVLNNTYNMKAYLLFRIVLLNR